MNIAYALGLAAGLLAATVILFILKRCNRKEDGYDERQEIARGKAFKGGFLTFTAGELVVFMVEIFTGEPLVIGQPGILSCIIILLSVLVFVEVSIFSDAYFTPNKPMSKVWFVIMTLLGISFIIKFFIDNDDWYRYMNLAAGIFIVITMASIILKKLISRKEEKDQDEE